VNANSLRVNLLVTAMVAALVVFLPLIDQLVCKKLGLNVRHGLSTHPHAARLLRLRKILLCAIFLLYAMCNAYLVLFSRNTSGSYQVHIDPLGDVIASITTDRGFTQVFRTLFTKGIGAAFNQIHIVNADDIKQMYMNIMLYVPMGYLLPYVFDWFRARPRFRPLAAGLCCSFITENLQLIFQRGLYDLDDMISNTFGALIGQLLFLSLAYVVTHPDWRTELKRYRRWRHNAHRRTLYPFVSRLSPARVTIRATQEETVWSFYVKRLGFRMLRQLIHEDDDGTAFLLQMGGVQLELICSNTDEELEPQRLTFQVRNLDKVRKRMEKHGFTLGAYEIDPYTNHRMLSFEGPDHVTISMLE